MSFAFAFIPLCIVAMFLVQMSAQDPTCDITGCLNGECLVPPLVPAPFCNCSQGFKILSDPFVCEDIDECSENYFICGFTLPSRYYFSNGYPPYPGFPPFWPYVPAGRCVNTPGNFYCLCEPPFIPILSYQYCARPRRGQQSSSLSTLTRLALVNQAK